MNCIDYMNKISFGISIAFCVLCSCTSRTGQKSSDETLQVDSLAQDTIAETVAEPVVKKITPEEIQITKELLYDKYTLDAEYKRDVAKGLPIAIPKNYYPGDDPEQPPLFRWRAHAHLLYENWLNYYVYQNTPYDLGAMERVKHEK